MGARVKWAARERPKIDRIACPSLAARFIDPTAESLFVSAVQVIPLAQGWARWLALLVLSLGLVPSSFAQGGPPMLTDDPGTPGSGAWEINSAYLEQRTRQERVRSLPHVDFNYGLGEHIQLKYETGWLFVDAPEGQGVKNGLDDSLLGVKWRFLDQERNGIDMSVYPQLQVENSTGSVQRGIAEPGPNLFLPVEIGHDFGKMKLIGEIGYQYFRTQENEWVVGLLGALEVSDTLELLAEARSFSEKLLNRGDVVVNVGLRQALTPRVKLLASVGTGLTSGPETTTFIAYLGVQLLLGKR